MDIIKKFFGVCYFTDREIELPQNKNLIDNQSSFLFINYILNKVI